MTFRLSLAMAAVASFAMAPARAGEPALPHGISYGFDFSKRYEANQIVVLLNAKGEASTLSGAMQKANVLGAKVVDRVAKAGIRKEEIVMMKGGAFPSNYGFFGKIKEYECVSEIEIRTGRFDVVNAISSLLADDDDLSISLIRYSHDKTDSLKRIFTAEAMRRIVAAKADYEASLGSPFKVCAVMESGPAGRELTEAYRGGLSKGYSKKEIAFEGFSATPNLEYAAHYQVQLCP